jgi:hypothetical protein
MISMECGDMHFGQGDGVCLSKEPSDDGWPVERKEGREGGRTMGGYKP